MLKSDVVVTSKDYIPVLLSFPGERKKLKDGAVPSVLPFRRASRADLDCSACRIRRAASCTVTSSSTSKDPHSSIQVPEVAAEVSVPSSSAADPSYCIKEEPIADPSRHICCCNHHDSHHSSRLNFSIEKFRTRRRIVKYYTGFSNYDHFMLLFNILGPCIDKLSVDTHLHPKDQLFLTLKLRQAKDDFELSILFDIRPNTVSALSHTWISFFTFS